MVSTKTPFSPFSSDYRSCFPFLLFIYEYICSKIEEAKSDNVSIDCLKSLEEQLKTALSVTRARKVYMLLLRYSVT